MAEKILMIVMGVFFVALGAITFLGNIKFIHSHNRKKITEGTRKPYGRVMGTGTIIIGIGIFVAGILELFNKSVASSSVALASVIVGIVVMLYAQIKYNRGIF